MLSILLLTTDVNTPPSSEISVKNHSLQTVFMHKCLTMGIDPAVTKNAAVCGWHGVTCENGYVKRLNWSTKFQHQERRSIDVRWMPPSVKYAVIFAQPIVMPIETRALPRGLCVGSFVRCGVQGTIDLIALPPHIVEFLVSDNRITGYVSLLHLPETVEALAVNENEITTIYGKSGSIPKRAKDISMWPRVNGVKARYVSIDVSKMDKRIKMKNGRQ